MSAAIAAVAVGAALVVGSQFLEKKPKVPGLESIDPTQQGKDAANANLAALPDAQKLGQQVDAYNQAELDKSFADIFPGYKDAARQAGSNIEDLLSGKISDTTAAEVSRRAAARSVGSTGSFGPRGQSLEARDFGITSEAQKSRGLTALSGWLASAKGSLIAPKFDVTSMFLTPQQLYTNRNEQAVQQFQRQNAANQVDAYYSAESRGARGMQQAGSMIGGFGSGMGGGGGGGAKPSGGGQAFDYGNIDTMMNGPAQTNSFYSPTNYGATVPPANYYSGGFGYSQQQPAPVTNWWGS